MKNHSVAILKSVIFATFFFFTANSISAQQPFLTDNTDVTDKGKFHFEVGNEIDRLQSVLFPDKYQNGFHATLAYGLMKNVEVSITGTHVVLVSNTGAERRLVGGIGDTTIAVKYNFIHEHEGSRLPAFTISPFVQFPTGNAARALGSGKTDYGFNAVAQKTYHKKNVVRVNAGYLFAGNTVTGVLGISAVRGHVFSGGVSYVRNISEKLQLGSEIVGAVTNQFQLSRGQLQTQFGGNYNLTKKMSLDFGIIAGKFAASPRFGGQLGVSIDF
jgi:hypothetical protein